MFSLLMLTALIPAAQAIEPAPSPDPSNTITINNPSAASKANKTIVCSQITEEQDSLRLKFMDTTGAKVVFYNDSASELKLKIMPAVSGLEASLAGDSLYLRGEFQPETRYSIQLIGALRAASGNTLKHQVALQHRTGKLKPQLKFVTEGLYFTTGAKNFNLPFSLRSTEKYQLEIWRLYDNNLDITEAIRSDYKAREYGEPVVRTTIPIPAAAKHTEKTPFAERFQCGKNPFECIIGMRIINVSGNSVGERDPFQSSGYGKGSCHCVPDFTFRKSRHHCRGDCFGYIVNIMQSDQGRMQFHGAERCF